MQKLTQTDRVLPLHHPSVLISVARAQGADLEDLLNGTDVTPDMLSDPEARICYEQYNRITGNAIRLTGNQALDYVRVRHGISANGDIGRMKRQQAFIAAMVEKVVAKGTLANPVRLYRFLDAATQSLTTDTGFG